jgi:uncharacterized protein (DUF1778 family)
MVAPLQNSVPAKDTNLTTTARSGLKPYADDNDTSPRAAVLMSAALAAPVRAAANMKALTLLDDWSKVRLSRRDFAAFSAAINKPYAPNPTLKDALAAAKRIKRF